jgi:DNA-binding beta-propeller fold protein YncE
MTEPLDLLPTMLGEVPDLDDETFARLSNGLRALISTDERPAPPRRQVRPGARRGRRVRLRRVAVVAFVLLAVTTAVFLAASPKRVTRPPLPSATKFSALVVADRTSNNTRQTVLMPLDTATGQLGKTIVVPAQGAVDLAPGGRIALLLDVFHDVVYVVDLAGGRVGLPIDAGPMPDSVAFSPDGTMAYVADAGRDGCLALCPTAADDAESDLVTPVNLLTGVPRPPIRTCSGPVQVAMAPSGATLWVACFFGGVDEVSTSSDTVVAHYDVPGSPGNFAFADGGRTVIVGQITVEDLQTAPNDVVLIDTVTGRVGKPIAVGLPGGTAVDAVSQVGVAYVATFGHTGPGGEVTTELVPLDIATGRLGPRLAVRSFPGEPVAVAGYWPGVGVRYVTFPDSSGNLGEGEPGSPVANLVRTGIGDAQIVAIDPAAPYLIVAGRASGAGATPVEVVSLLTGRVGGRLQLPASVTSFSVQFPVTGAAAPSLWP